MYIYNVHIQKIKVQLVFITHLCIAVHLQTVTDGRQLHKQVHKLIFCHGDFKLPARPPHDGGKMNPNKELHIMLRDTQHQCQLCPSPTLSQNARGELFVVRHKQSS